MTNITLILTIVIILITIGALVFWTIQFIKYPIASSLRALLTFLGILFANSFLSLSGNLPLGFLGLSIDFSSGLSDSQWNTAFISVSSLVALCLFLISLSQLVNDSKSQTMVLI